ncbi:MAG: hypothetical protein ACK4GE_02145 [Caldimicrobium sp.]
MTKFEKKVVIGGAFIGLILFVILGFLPSAYTGGLVGLKLAKLLFGDILQESVGPRILIGLLMVTCVILSGAIFIIGCATISWILAVLVGRKKVKEKGSTT